MKYAKYVIAVVSIVMIVWDFIMAMAPAAKTTWGRVKRIWSEAGQDGGGI